MNQKIQPFYYLIAFTSVRLLEFRFETKSSRLLKENFYISAPILLFKINNCDKKFLNIFFFKMVFKKCTCHVFILCERNTAQGLANYCKLLVHPQISNNRRQKAVERTK